LEASGLAVAFADTPMPRTKGRAMPQSAAIPQKDCMPIHHLIRDKLKIEMGMTPKSMLHQIYRRP
jgi:hypothetical protein